MTDDPAAPTTVREHGAPPVDETGAARVAPPDGPAPVVADEAATRAEDTPSAEGTPRAEAARRSEGAPSVPGATTLQGATTAEAPTRVEARVTEDDVPPAADDRAADDRAAGDGAAGDGAAGDGAVEDPAAEEGAAADSAAAPAEQVGGSRAVLLRRALGTVQVLALWALTWPSAALSPVPGLDPSFRWSLQQAFVEGRRFGTEIIFTFGPLGFLTFPELYFTRPTFLSLAARSVVMLAGCGFVLWSVRRVVRNRAVAFLVAYGLVSLSLTLLVTYLSETICALLVSGSLAVVLGGELGRRRRVAVLVTIGATAALLALMKLNTGITAGLVGALAAVSLASGTGLRLRQRLVDLGTFLLAGLVSFLLGWLLTAQHLSDLVPYVRASRELTSGYSSAMSLEIPTARWEYFPALLALAGALASVAVVALAAARRHGRSRLWALMPVAMFGLAAFSLLKHGFVRHDTHSFVFFLTLPVLALGLLHQRVATLLTGVIAVSLVAATAVVNLNLSSALSPTQHLDDLRYQAAAVRSSSTRAELRAESRARLANGYGLDARSLELLAGKRVHVDPWESSVLFAHPQLTWAPVPVFQTYSAYTAELDRRNAEVLASPAGPDVVLREVMAIDGRATTFESPEYMLAMACNFTEAHAQERWFVLTRTPDRCGAPAVVAEVEAAPGEAVALPESSACPGILTLRVEGLMASAAAKLLDLVYKGSHYSLDVAGGSYRLLPLHAAQPHVLWVPGDPAWMEGWLGFRGGGEIAVQALPTVGLFADVGAEDQLRYTFECVPLQREAPARALGA